MTKWFMEDRKEALDKAKKLSKALAQVGRNASVSVWNLQPTKRIYDRTVGTPTKCDLVYGWGSMVRGPRRGTRREVFCCVPVHLLEWTKQNHAWMIGPMSDSMKVAQGI
jgi:hypothetical protein